MVFFGEARGRKHAHDAGSAMTIALLPLAFGTLTSWLLVGAFGRFLDSALPAGQHRVVSTAAVLHEVAASPWTYGVLVAVALGITAWFARARLEPVSRLFAGLGRAAANSFGFEAVNRGIVAVTQGSAEALRGSQTGLLSWNILGIVAGLAAVLILLALGGA
jgi:NADH-quinone oxidoreductase subunit L